MLKTEYLYDCKPEIFAKMSYIDAINLKVEKAKLLHRRLFQEIEDYEEPYNTGEFIELKTRCNRVYNAIEFNRNMMEEMNEK